MLEVNLDLGIDKEIKIQMYEIMFFNISYIYLKKKKSLFHF